MAKAARLSGQEPDSEDYEEFEDLLEQDSESGNKVSIYSLEKRQKKKKNKTRFKLALMSQLM